MNSIISVSLNFERAIKTIDRPDFLLKFKKKMVYLHVQFYGSSSSVNPFGVPQGLVLVPLFLFYL